MKMRALALGLAAVAALLCHCTQEDDLDVDLVVPSPVAVGATVNATLAGGKMDQASVDDSSIFTIVSGGGTQQQTSIELRALRAGKTTFRARGDNGKKLGTIKEEIEAAMPTRVSFTGVANCGSPYLIGAGAAFTVNAKRFRGQTELAGTGGFFPIDSDIATNNADTNEFRAGSSAGLGFIRSKIDDAKLRIEVFEASQATSMKLASSGNAKVGSDASIASTLEVAGQRVCADEFARDVVIATPDVCETKGATTGTSIAISAKKAGTCELSVTLTGTSVSATTTFLVDDKGTLPADAGTPSDAGPDDAGDAGIADAAAD